MRKVLIALFLLYGIVGKVQAIERPGNDLGDLNHILTVCVADPDVNYIQQCNSLGIVYETLYTELFTAQNEKITFTTNTVVANGEPLTQKHSGLAIYCNSCNDNSYSDLKLRVNVAFEYAAYDNGFNTTLVSRNGKKKNEPSKPNNGGTFSNAYKEFAEGTKIFAEVWAKFSGGEREEFRFDLLITAEGKVLAIVKIFVEDSPVVVASFENTIINADGSFSYDASMNGSDVDSFESFMDKVFEPRTGSRCTIVYTGTVDHMTAQVICD
jgi:hypothetical protein